MCANGNPGFSRRGASTASLGRRIAFRSAAVGLATLFGLYVSEAALCLLHRPVTVTEARGEHLDARAAVAARLGVPFDSCNPLDVILGLRAQGRLAYPCGSIESYFGFGGIALSSDEDPKNVLGDINPMVRIRGAPVLPLGHPSQTLLVSDDNENGDYPVFVTDERGFRNPLGIWRHGQADIVGVGDSFVEGCEVKDEESFMSRIRERVPRTVNLGLGGGGPLTALATLREYGSLLRPKVVLWCYYSGNDYQDTEVHLRSPILNAYLNDDRFSQNLAARQTEIDDALRDFLEWEVQAVQRLRQKDSIGSYLSLSRLRAMVTAFARTTARRSSREPADVLASLQVVAVKMKALAESWGGRLYFVYLPDTGTLLRPPHWNEVEQLRILHEMIEALGISFVDLSTPLGNRADRAALLPFGLPGHFNAMGNHVVAEEILKRLEADPAGPLHTRPEAQE